MQRVAAAEGSTEFTLNLFTDIAPILALFGEQFAQQYLSQNFTWLDHLIFACVPLGIITALSGAIRTRGPRLARSFIGRARENLATVEIGLMSSVSHEVCEMFNGSGTIRTMGRSTLMQIIFFPDAYDAVRRGASDPSCGIHTLQTAVQSGGQESPAMFRSEYQGKTYQRLRKLWDPEQDADQGSCGQPEKAFDFKCPPNLQLNVSAEQFSHTRKAAELWAASITAVTLQLSLLAIAAVMAYHERFSKATGHENHFYGFPCYVAGSVLLCVGMAICSAAIESSTDEFVWRPSRAQGKANAESDSGTTRDPSIMWIQQPQSVGDQSFESYVILGGPKPYVLTSSRSKDLWTTETSNISSKNDHGDGNEGKGRRWEFLTLIGVLSGVLGFTAQFVGLRGLPWPVAVSQLLAILIMALVRALLRRGVGVIPLACRALPSHELDFLAARIVFYPSFRGFKDGDPMKEHLRDQKLRDVCRWRVMTASESRIFTAFSNVASDDLQNDTDSTDDWKAPEGFQEESSQQLVNVRERLGDLCKWKSSVSEMAVVFAHWIESFMTVFFKDSKMQQIPWTIKASKLMCNGKDGTDEAMILIQKKRGKWVVELGKVEAIYSLWMASFEAQHLDMEEKRDTADNYSDPSLKDWRRSRSSQVKFRRIIGDLSEDAILRRDISWWVGHHITSECEGRRESPLTTRSGNDGEDLSIGFDTPAKADMRLYDSRMIHSSTAALPSVMAQHLFTSFIWAVSGDLPRNCLHQGERNVKDFVAVDPANAFDTKDPDAMLDRSNLSHTQLTNIAREGGAAGLGTITDILLCMIPALSFRDLLPNEVVLGFMPSDSQTMRRYGWQKMAGLHSSLLRRRLDPQEHLGVSVLVDAIEFIFLASDGHELMERLTGILHQIVEDFPDTLKQLAPFYHLQTRAHKLSDIFRRCGLGNSVSNAMLPEWDVMVKEEGFSNFRKTIRFTDAHWNASQGQRFDATDTNTPDIFGWTALHYAAAAPRDGRALLPDILPAIRQGKAHSCLDKSHRNPLHITASSGHVQFLNAFIDMARPKVLKSALRSGGLDGRTLLHLAVEGKHLQCVELLLKHQAPCQTDVCGRNPVHLAALGRSGEIGIRVLAQYPKTNQVDEFGNTPLSYLLKNESEAAADQGRIDLARELMVLWTDNKADDGSGNSFLHYAAAFSDGNEIESLAEELGNVDVRNRHDQTPLHLAAFEGNTAAAENLINLGARVGMVDNRDRTPLHMAMAACQASTSMLLVSEGAEIRVRDKDGETPLQLALEKNQKDVIEELLCCERVSIGWDTAGPDGVKPLDSAAKHCKTECLGIVILHEATTIPERIYGLKAMTRMRVWQSDDAELFEFVIESIPERQLSLLELEELTRGPVTRAWDSRRYGFEALREDPSALHQLTKYGDTAMIRRLLEAGADASRRDEYNKLPSDIADRYGQGGAGDLLRDHVAAMANGERPGGMPHRGERARTRARYKV